MNLELPETYDVLFVTRKNGQTEITGTLAVLVNKETAIELAKRYCHRSEANEGVMIAYHGTTIAPKGSEWWFDC